MDGAALYACPYDLKAGEKFFYSNALGFYSWVIGMNLSSLLRSQLPELTKFCSQEEAERIRHSFANNWRGLKQLDEDLYVPMFGYKDCEDYYTNGTMTGQFHKIKVPTFCLSANDDFITPYFTNPTKEVTAPGSNVVLTTTEFGGHCTHIAGWLKPK